MKNRAKSQIALLLSLILASLELFSCGGEAVDPNGTTANDENSTETTAALSAEDQRKLIDDGLPDVNYGGKEFNITVNTFCQSGFFTEEMSGDVLEDAIYERNKAVEDRFNVKFNFITGDFGDQAAQIQSSVLAGDDEYQLLTQHALTACSWVSAGILNNWYDMKYVDFEKPWWSPSNREDLTYNGKTFLAVGDFSLTTIGRTYAIYYDKVNAESYGLPDMYQLVRDGKWTIDKLSELTKNIYTDLNGNGERDFDDFYGYSTSVTSNIGAYLFTSGLKIIDKGEIALDVGKTSDLITKLINLTQVNEGTFYDKNYKNDSGNPHYAGAEKMAAGTTIFASAMIETGIKYLRDNDNDYGIIPYPKWDEEQDDYITIVDGGFTMLAIPKTVVDTEMSGIIAEALCAETYKNVIPVYYDIAIKEKGARDEESLEMIDFIMSKRVYDFGYVYDEGYSGFGFCLERMVKEDNPNFASYYAANIERISKQYNDMLACFE